MQILNLNNYKIPNSQNINKTMPVFQAHGKPLTLQYIVENRAHLLPERVLIAAKKALAETKKELPSLLEIHKSIYSPLLQYNSLADVKRDFPEFAEIKDRVKFKRESVYSRDFYNKTDANFSLKMLQEYWGNLKQKDEIAKEIGLRNRTSLDWPLEAINFVGFPHNYKTLLKASDEEGNRLIASKTIAWNSLHPDLMYAHNKKAAQGCKTEEYRQAQSERIKKYDTEHPERKEKISRSLKRGWENCPEVRDAMSEFARRDAAYIRHTLKKKVTGKVLNDYEERTLKSFYKRFWAANPELKAVYSEARKGCNGLE